MSTIAVLIVEPEERTFVARQLAGVAAPRFCDTVEGLERLVAGGTVRAVLSDVRDRSGAEVLPVLRSCGGS